MEEIFLNDQNTKLKKREKFKMEKGKIITSTVVRKAPYALLTTPTSKKQHKKNHKIQ